MPRRTAAITQADVAGVTSRGRIAQAAVILGVAARTVQDLAAREELPGCKVGRVWTFDPDRLKKWLDRKEIECAKNGLRRAGPWRSIYELKYL